MRILLLTSFDLFPPVHGGSTIAYNFIKHATTRHQVVAVLPRLYSQGGPVDLEGPNAQFHYCQASTFDNLRVFSFFINPHYYRLADRLCRRTQPDVIQCETLWPVLVGLYLRRRYGVPVLCVEYNVEGDKFADLGRPWPVVAAVRAVERFACRHADAVITVSDPDRQKLVHQYGQATHVHTIRPSPDSDFQFDEHGRAAVRRRLGLAEDAPLLAFVGNLQYEPNQAAVRYIADGLYPAVMGRHPAARFLIVGQRPELVAESRRPHIIFTGYLSRQDLVAHLSAADIVLVPVHVGSGIRVKIPEATACARVVVTTRKAATGLEMFTDREIVRVDAVGPAFAAAVLDLMDNPERRRDMGQRARERTQIEFGWDRALVSYEEVYAGIGALA